MPRIEIPHSVCKYTCMVNVISDVYEWKTGRKLPCQFMMSFSGTAGFTYLKFKRAKPPCMVFWGPSIRVQYKNLKEIFGIEVAIVNEGRSFANAMKLLKRSIDEGNPVVVGPLDMHWLQYTEFFMKLHATAHFILINGYDESAREVYAYDCNFKEQQSISYENLEQAWKTDEKGYLRRNSVITFSIPRTVPSLEVLVKKGLLHRADEMLNPPIRNFGVSGIMKLSEEFRLWETWMSKGDYVLALQNLVMFANVPPTLSREVDNFTASRREFSNVLKDLAHITERWHLEHLSDCFRDSEEKIRLVCHIILNYLDGKEDERGKIPEVLSQMAEIEREAYGLIRDRLG
jgi:hypothetical protein